MRPHIALLLRCYPARWRARYGDEFEALLGERSLGPFDVADVLLGAVDAHLHLRGLGAASAHQKGFTMSLRIGGYAAIIGGLLWLVALIGNAINNGGEGSPILGYAVVAATAATLVALVGLSAFQARRHPLLVWAACVIPVAGAAVGLLAALAMFLGNSSDTPLIAGIDLWVVASFGLLAMVAGSALFALATWITRTLSRWAAATLGAGALLVVPALFGITGNLLPPAGALVALIVTILLFPAGWVALGVSALRTGRAGFIAPEPAGG
jgi:hypothetical protein